MKSVRVSNRRHHRPRGAAGEHARYDNTELLRMPGYREGRVYYSAVEHKFVDVRYRGAHPHRLLAAESDPIRGAMGDTLCGTD